MAKQGIYFHTLKETDPFLSLLIPDPFWLQKPEKQGIREIYPTHFSLHHKNQMHYRIGNIQCAKHLQAVRMKSEGYRRERHFLL